MRDTERYENAYQAISRLKDVFNYIGSDFYLDANRAVIDPDYREQVMERYLNDTNYFPDQDVHVVMDQRVLRSVPQNQTLRQHVQNSPLNLSSTIVDMERVAHGVYF